MQDHSSAFCTVVIMDRIILRIECAMKMDLFTAHIVHNITAFGLYKSVSHLIFYPSSSHETYHVIGISESD